MSTKQQRAFYNSKSWRLTRKRQLAKQPMCVECQRLGVMKLASHVDHIKSIESGGDKHDPDNLRSLCAGCHSYKTVREDHGFGNAKAKGKQLRRGCDSNGLPLDPDHPWAGGTSNHE